VGGTETKPGSQPAGFVSVPPTLEDVYFGVMDESRAADAARASVPAFATATVA
jgi:hypothetical protein